MTAPIETEANQALVGTVLAGRYRIERLLGTGGMGAVYRAEHVLMRKACAVKVLHREMTQVKEVVARFEREAVAAARIEHPNVAAATDFGQLEDGSFYLVLEFIEGKSLSQQIAHLGALPEERALLIARQIADALAAAHAAGIVHRDLKPDNVMLVSKEGAADFVKVLDFGIAKLESIDPAKHEQALTRLNTVMGTPEYMAPEQARGEAVDHRADLYTVGAILYEMLAGTSPFRHDEFVVILTKKLTEDPPALPASVSAPTQELVSLLLRRAPEERPQSAVEIVARIDGILGYSPAPTSLAFAPMSGQASPTSPKVSIVGVAYANTVIGEVPAGVLEKPWRRQLRSATVQARALAKRRVQLGSKQVSLGVVGAALLGLPVVLALTFSAIFSGSQAAKTVAGVVQLPEPENDDVADLMTRAEAGEARALVELSTTAPETKNAAAFRSLGRGYFKVGQIDAGLRAYRAGAKLDPKFGDAAGVIDDVRRASVDAANQITAVDIAAELGAVGADLLYEVWDTTRSVNPVLAKQAKALLDSDAVLKQASPALKVALELPKAKAVGCGEVKKLLPRVIESGDARSVSTLGRLGERRGCGFLGLKDCYGCLRAGKDLATAQKAAAARPTPRVGG